MAKKKEEMKKAIKVEEEGLLNLVGGENKSLFKPIFGILEFAIPSITDGEITVDDVYVDVEKGEHGFVLNIAGTSVSVTVTKTPETVDAKIKIEYADGNTKKFEYHEERR